MAQFLEIGFERKCARSIDGVGFIYNEELARFLEIGFEGKCARSIDRAGFFYKKGYYDLL